MYVVLVLPYQEGIVLEDGQRIAVDTRRRVPGALHVITHAHLDHAGAARRCQYHATDATILLLQARGLAGGISHPFGEPFSDELVLFPAGHIPGSAMLYVNEGNGVLVTGDFKLEKDVIAEPIWKENVDVLIMDTTFFAPEYLFPPRRQLYSEFFRKVEEWVNNGKKVLLFAYNVGKAQEVTALLNYLGIIPAVELEAYRANVILGLKSKVIGREGWKETNVLLLPPSRMKILRYLRIDPNLRWLYCSGWSKTFPLSSHSDFRQSIEIVEATQPRLVLTYGQNAAIAARELRKRGWRAEPLIKPVIL